MVTATTRTAGDGVPKPEAFRYAANPSSTGLSDSVKSGLGNHMSMAVPCQRRNTVRIRAHLGNGLCTEPFLSTL